VKSVDAPCCVAIWPVLETGRCTRSNHRHRTCSQIAPKSLKPDTERTEAFFPYFTRMFLVIIIIHGYFIHISQSSVETYLRCGGIYNNHIFVQRVCQWKNFKNRWLIGDDMDKSKVPRFLWPTLYVSWSHGCLLRKSDKLNWPKWLDMYWKCNMILFYMFTNNHTAIQVVTGPGVAQLRWFDTTCYRYATPLTN